MFNYFLGIFLSFFNVDTAMKLTLAGDHESSTIVLNKTKMTKENAGEYLFLRASNAYALNKKPEALKWIDMLISSFHEMPERYRNLGYIMEMEIQGWGHEDLGDIGRDMRISKERLKLGQGGRRTQKVQTDIISKLDKLIQDKENQANDKNAQANAGKDKANDTNIKKPAIEEDLSGVSGRGVVDDKKIRVLAERWGTMPEKERVKVIMELTRDLPARYRVIIEDYFKALANKPIP